VSLPAFPALKPLGLEDRAEVEGFLDRHPPDICELNFANIFIWRAIERPRLSLHRGRLCVFVEPPGEPPYALPPVGEGPLDPTVEACLTIVPRLSRVPEPTALGIGPGFVAKPDPDNFDYVYQRSDLAELKGKRYDGKRNRIRKFEREHGYRYREIGPDCLVDCRRLLDDWLEAKAGNGWDLEAQRTVVGEALLYFRELGLRGGGVEVDGRLAAFAIGSRLGPDTALCMIEIVDPALDGLAQLINREFARRAWPDVAYINREQDMGIEGLRRAKQSYHPVRLVKKFDVGR
jgi:hypothetical protein